MWNICLQPYICPLPAARTAAASGRSRSPEPSRVHTEASTSASAVLHRRFFNGFISPRANVAMTVPVKVWRFVRSTRSWLGILPRSCAGAVQTDIYCLSVCVCIYIYIVYVVPLDDELLSLLCGQAPVGTSEVLLLQYSSCNRWKTLSDLLVFSYQNQDRTKHFHRTRDSNRTKPRLLSTPYLSVFCISFHSHWLWLK